MPRQQSVTTHKRTMRNGTTVTVHQHKRSGLQPGRAWRNAKRGWKHQRNGNPGRAAFWSVLAVAEIGGYAAFGVTGVVLTTAGVLMAGIGVKMLKATKP